MRQRSTTSMRGTSAGRLSVGARQTTIGSRSSRDWGDVTVPGRPTSRCRLEWDRGRRERACTGAVFLCSPKKGGRRYFFRPPIQVAKKAASRKGSRRVQTCWPESSFPHRVDDRLLRPQSARSECPRGAGQPASPSSSVYGRRSGCISEQARRWSPLPYRVMPPRLNDCRPCPSQHRLTAGPWPHQAGSDQSLSQNISGAKPH